MAARQFKSLFCERFGCEDAAYETAAFKKCLHWQARLLEPIVRRMQPDYFAIDQKFIRDLGATTGTREARRETLDYSDAVRARKAFLRTGLNIRVSGRKATALAHQLFRER